jgi:hypothetical protein
MRRSIASLGLALLIEPRARILVRAAWTPVLTTLFGGLRRVAAGPLRLLGRIPQLAPREVPHRYIAVGPAQLRDGGEQFLALARAERCGLAVDEDRPVRVSRRHTGA